MVAGAFEPSVIVTAKLWVPVKVFDPDLYPKLRDPTRYIGVYVIGWDECGPVKIGQALNIKERLDQLQTGNPYRLRVFGAFYVSVIGRCRGNSLEREAHRRLGKTGLRMSGEWFDIFADEAVEFLTSIIAEKGWDFMPLGTLYLMHSRTLARPDGMLPHQKEAFFENLGWLYDQLDRHGEGEVDWAGKLDPIHCPVDLLLN